MELNGQMNINKTGIRLVKKVTEKVEESRQTESSNNKMYAQAGLIVTEYTRKQNGHYDMKIECSA